MFGEGLNIREVVEPRVRRDISDDPDTAAAIRGAIELLLDNKPPMAKVSPNKIMIGTYNCDGNTCGKVFRAARYTVSICPHCGKECLCE